MAYKNNPKKLAFWAILAVLGLIVVFNFGGIDDKFWLAEYSWEHSSNGAPGPELKLTNGSTQTTYLVEQPDGTNAKQLSTPNPNYYHYVDGVWMITKTTGSVYPKATGQLYNRAYFEKEYPAPTGYELRIPGKGKSDQAIIPDQQWLENVQTFTDKQVVGSGNAEGAKRNDMLMAAMEDQNVVYWRVAGYTSGTSKMLNLFTDTENSDRKVKEVPSSFFSVDYNDNKDPSEIFGTPATNSYSSSSNQDTGSKTSQTEVPGTQQTTQRGYQQVTGSATTPSTTAHGYQKQT